VAQVAVLSTTDPSSRSSTYVVQDLATGRASAPASGRVDFTVMVPAADLALLYRGDIDQHVDLWHLPSGTRRSWFTNFVPGLAHPRLPVVFGGSRGLMARADAAGVVTWDLCPGRMRGGYDLTLDGATLLLVCSDGTLVVADSATGQVRRQVMLAPGPYRRLVANGDGSRVVVQRDDATHYTVIAVVDTTTGADVSTITPWPFAGPGTVSMRQFSLLQRTAARDRVAVTQTWYYYDTGGRSTSAVRTELLGLDDLQPRSVLQTGLPLALLVFSPDGQHAYVTGRGVTDERTQQVFDTTSGQVLAGLADRQLTVGGVAFAPLAPVDVVATVTGRTVRLAWTLPAHSPAARSYRLEIGTTPGASDLGMVEVGSATDLTASSVPPGRYYARVVATNAIGRGTASAAVEVTVSP